MIVLGLDPGIDRLGWAIIKDVEEGIGLSNYGLITTNKEAPSAVRLAEIFTDLQELIKTHHPDIVYTESLFFSVNAKTAMMVSEVRGVIKAVSALNNFVIKEIHPLTLKKKIIGTGKATKKEVQAAIKSLFAVAGAFKTDDVADAIAIGYVGILEALGQI